METVSFACQKCGNLLTVEQRRAGENVLCLHCQHINVTPAGSSPQPPTVVPLEPNFSVPRPEDQESIFDAAIHTDDSLFSVAAMVQVEMPSMAGQPLSPPLANEETPSASHHEPEPQAHPVDAFDEVVSADLSPSFNEDVSALMPVAESVISAPASLEIPEPLLASSPQSAPADQESTSFSGSHSLDQEGILAPGPVLELPSLPTRRPIQAGMGGSLFIALVLIPLISYSILATIAICILYFRPPPDPLERLPDIEGDYTGAKHEKQGAISYERPSPDLGLPNKLKISLGQSILVGNVAITPERIELRRLNLRPPASSKAIVSHANALVLYLLLQNISRDIVFCPMDPYFNRRWKNPSFGSKPYTYLEIGKRRLFGGPLLWKQGMAPEEKGAVEGQTYETLHPGETWHTFVCTDPDDLVDKLLQEQPAHLLWRVQVRRGLVQIGDRERSATAVVGVEFAQADIQRPKG